MEESPVRITTACPKCAKTFSVDRSHVGKSARCKACGEVFVIAVADEKPPAARTPEPAPTPAPEPASEAAAGAGMCPVCQGPIGAEEDRFACPGCNVLYHRSCWEYNRGCGMYGCSQAPATEGLKGTEIPASYWGQENKECPACRRTILAAAIRCQHCGTTFSSARPENTVEFIQRKAQMEGRPALRRNGILLLIFSVLSCTAPLAAIVGGVWYYQKKQEIAKLPAIQASIPKIALVVAVAQTVLIVIVSVLYAIFSSKQG